MKEWKAFQEIFRLLTPSERRRCIAYQGLMLVGALLDTLSIGVLLPLMMAIMDPGQVEQIPVLSQLRRLPFVENEGTFILVMLGCVLLLYLVRGAFSFLISISQARFSVHLRLKLSRRLFSCYLNKPYPFYFDHNTSVLQRNVNQLCPMAVNGILMAGFSVMTQAFFILLTVALLAMANALSALAVAAALAGLCLLLYQKLKRRLEKTAQEMNQCGRQMVQASYEALGTVKEIIVLGRRRRFSDRFDALCSDFEKASVQSVAVAQIPSVLIELFTVAGLVAVAAILLMGGGPVSGMLPVLTVFGAAVVKLMPAAKGLYSASTGMRANTVYLKEYYEDLKEAMERPSPAEEEGDAASFAGSLRFEGVSFTYPGSSSPVLEQVDFILHRGDFVGLSGPSGGGKSTLIDLLLGLLEPTEGRILLDGVPIAGRTGSWQRLVGYVPQHIRLLDDTLEHNVALGLPDEEIDRERVWQVLEDAQLSDFVKSLPDGLGSRVGETGIRLSGGQRQRIGIARALYNDPQVLVFDEATSALDAKTEEALTRTIADLGKGRTILLAAHRERTLARCTSRYRVTGRGVCREETAAQKQ